MIAIKALALRLAHRPFEPFRVVTSSGESYNVRHPDAAMLTRNWLIVAYGKGQNGVYNDAAHLSLLHITAVEPLTSPNGSSRKSTRQRARK